MISTPSNYFSLNRLSDDRRRRSIIDTAVWTIEREQKNGTKALRSRSVWIPICQGFIIGILLVGVALAVILTMWLTSKTSTTTSSTSTMTTNVSVMNTATVTTTSIITTSSTTTTTTVTCLTGYVQTPAGSCVNTQIDFNNCGSVGYVCPSNYTSCSAGICSTAPAVQITNGVGVPSWGGANTIDDDSYSVSLPFSISMHNYSTSNVTVTTNGVVCLGGCSTAFSNGNLPSGSFAGPTAFAFWDDLMIYANTAQTVYYGIGGQAPNRTAIFEFYESHISASSQYYHFQVIFYESAPGIVKYVYFEITDGGVSATVGVQQSGTGPATTYAVNQANSIPGNMTLTFNTNTGTFTG